MALFERVPRWLKIVFAFGGWAVAALGFLLDLPAKINSAVEEFPKAVSHIDYALLVDRSLTGAWSSVPEGDVIAKQREPEDGVPVEVDLYVRSMGSVEGVIGSGGLRERYIYPQVLVEGHKTSGVIEAEAWDVAEGKKIVLATFRLLPEDRGGEPVLIFSVIDQGGRFFPDRAILWRTKEISELDFNERLLRLPSQ